MDFCILPILMLLLCLAAALTKIWWEANKNIDALCTIKPRNEPLGELTTVLYEFEYVDQDKLSWDEVLKRTKPLIEEHSALAECGDIVINCFAIDRLSGVTVYHFQVFENKGEWHA